nr:MAG TPA: PDGF/VEGF domain protein [Caudoviricetes sp.]
MIGSPVYRLQHPFLSPLFPIHRCSGCPVGN